MGAATGGGNKINIQAAMEEVNRTASGMKRKRREQGEWEGYMNGNDREQGGMGQPPQEVGNKINIQVQWKSVNRAAAADERNDRNGGGMDSRHR